MTARKSQSHDHSDYGTNKKFWPCVMILASAMSCRRHMYKFSMVAVRKMSQNHSFFTGSVPFYYLTTFIWIRCHLTNCSYFYGILISHRYNEMAWFFFFHVRTDPDTDSAPCPVHYRSTRRRSIFADQHWCNSTDNWCQQCAAADFGPSVIINVSNALHA